MITENEGGAEMPSTEDRFGWVEFYEAVANKLLDYRSNRGDLVRGVHDEITTKTKIKPLLDCGQEGGKRYPLEDIDPFTSMALFNRGMTDDNRRRIASAVAEFLKVKIDVPKSLEVGIPTYPSQQAWLFPFKFKRKEGHIDALWKVFAAALRFADSGKHREEFAQAYDAAVYLPYVKTKLSSGLYWARPRMFPSLDGTALSYMRRRLGLEISKERIDSKHYLQLIDRLNGLFREGNSPVRSFPELGKLAWHDRREPNGLGGDNGNDDGGDSEVSPSSYAVSDILKEGCFLSEDELNRHFERLSNKKNLILQGPPGTGKTWLAKRLAFALVGRKDERKVRTVQFHPNLSYEDFVRGYRPDGDGRLRIVDGPFMEAVQEAKADLDSRFVMVIEEINRGNPAQVLGEMLTLLETDKRDAGEALELVHPDTEGNRQTHVPPNLYVIGTMNIADRSLALMDFAFRRRFAFVTLEPRLDDAWHDWVVRERGIAPELAVDIRDRINSLNEMISEDPGSHSRIGHSYVTPPDPVLGSTRDWFRNVVETEIVPLLEEYWFDSPAKVHGARDRLLRNW